jgi:hypothetical protein
MKLHHPLCVLLAASLVGCAPALVGVQPLEPDNRDRRRLDLDQINASLRAATGYGWVDDEGNDHLVRLASTLGRADYRTNTAEDRSPSLVFQKFLPDAAHSVCGKVVSQDASRPAAERIFFLEAQASDTVASAPEAVEANIKQLLMRFHSRDVELGSDTLDAWMWMHESASFVSPNPQLAWNAVCVGLITHPDFYSY